MDQKLIAEKIAEICHEMNKTFCEMLGDFSQVSWSDTQEGIKRSATDGVLFRLSNQDATPEDMHGNWVKFKTEDGWSYGEAKSLEHKTHPCLVPYSMLPKLQRAKDDLFSLMVNTFKP